jgi:hypothetical protein
MGACGSLHAYMMEENTGLLSVVFFCNMYMALTLERNIYIYIYIYIFFFFPPYCLVFNIF